MHRIVWRVSVAEAEGTTRLRVLKYLLTRVPCDTSSEAEGTTRLRVLKCFGYTCSALTALEAEGTTRLRVLKFVEFSLEWISVSKQKVRPV